MEGVRQAAGVGYSTLSEARTCMCFLGEQSLDWKKQVWGTEGPVNRPLEEMAGGQEESLAQMLRKQERSEHLNSGWRV